MNTSSGLWPSVSGNKNIWSIHEDHQPFKTSESVHQEGAIHHISSGTDFGNSNCSNSKIITLIIIQIPEKNILLIVENGGISNDSNPHHQEAQPHLHILSERKPEDRVSTNHKSAFSLPEDNASTNQKPVYLHQSPEDGCGQLTNLDHHQQHSQLHLYLHHEELERMTTSAAG